MIFDTVDDGPKIGTAVTAAAINAGASVNNRFKKFSQFVCEAEYTASMPSGTRIVSGGIPLRGKLTASLAPDPITGAWKLKLEPPSLLDAIWLQFGQAVTSDAADLRFCAQCGNPFEAGGQSGRRADAKFCSDECRIDYNSLKRSQAQ